MELPTSYMSQIIEQVNQYQRSANAEISIFVFNQNDPETTFKPFIIDRLEIKEKFLSGYLDETILYAKFYPKDLYFMVENVEDLKAKIIIKFINETTFDVDTNIPFIIREYKVHIVNLEDLYKVTNIYKIYAEEEPELEQQVGTVVPVVIQLIHDDEYIFRKKRINVGFQKSKISNIIPFLCKKFQLKTLYIEENYLNDIEYQNIYIPPKYGRLNIMLDYLQKRYGIYPYGISYYYFNDIFYIYQPYLTTNLSNLSIPLVKFFKIPYNTNESSKYTYSYINNILHVLTNSDVLSDPVNIEELENDSNVITYLDSSRIFDNIKIGKSGVQLTNILFSSGVDNKINRVKKGSVLVKHTDSCTNSFMKSSEIAKKTTELITFTWNYSLPFSIQPGNPCQFIFDKNKDVFYQYGRVENISYLFNRKDQSFTTSNIFLISSNVQLRLNTFSQKL